MLCVFVLRSRRDRATQHFNIPNNSGETGHLRIPHQTRRHVSGGLCIYFPSLFPSSGNIQAWRGERLMSRARYTFDQDSKSKDRRNQTRQKGYTSKIERYRAETSVATTRKSITLSRFAVLFWFRVRLQAGMLFSREGIWRRLGSNLTLQPRETWLRDEWRLLDWCLSSHTLFCYSLFVRHPIKHALSDTLTLARANKVLPISSPSLSKQAFIAGSAHEMLFYHAREKTRRRRLYF